MIQTNSPGDTADPLAIMDTGTALRAIDVFRPVNRFEGEFKAFLDPIVTIFPAMYLYSISKAFGYCTVPETPFKAPGTNSVAWNTSPEKGAFSGLASSALKPNRR